jgi:hypothetical protein
MTFSDEGGRLGRNNYKRHDRLAEWSNAYLRNAKINLQRTTLKM